jgi:hypothetical protein
MGDRDVTADADESIRQAESSWRLDEAKEAELERLADEYLVACGAIKTLQRGRRNDAEAFTERQIRDKCGRDWHPEFNALRATCDKMELEYITLGDLGDFRYICRMNDRQFAVLELWVCGMRQAEIARTMDVSASYVKHTIKRCAKRILDKWQSMPYYGLWTVYFELIRRG